MRKSEENNKFRKKENTKSSMVQNRNVRKNTSAHRENVTLQKKCGGCQYQGMDYEKQLNKKHREVKRAFRQLWKSGAGYRNAGAISLSEQGQCYISAAQKRNSDFRGISAGNTFSGKD